MNESYYAQVIKIIETAHGVRLAPDQIDRLEARLADERKLAPRRTFAEAMAAAETGEGVVNIREHVLAVKNEE